MFMNKNVVIGILVGLLVISSIGMATADGYSRYKNAGASCSADQDCFGGLVCRNQVCSDRMISVSKAPRIVSTRAVGNSLLGAAKQYNSQRMIAKASAASEPPLVHTPGVGMPVADLKMPPLVHTPGVGMPVADLKMPPLVHTPGVGMPVADIKSHTRYYEDTGSRARPYDYSKATGNVVKKNRAVSAVTGLVIAGGRCDPQTPKCDFGLKCNPSLRICVRPTP